MSETTVEELSFDIPRSQINVIKVIGVGGGGSNAINHMYKQGIKGVDFVICNTDEQALQNSPIPNKIQLGVSLTEGLGAGSNPDVGEQSAVESYEEIKQMLDTHTKMVFITAGMGGGTGTGAAPVIAKMSKELDVLTVGIVTIPFQFEGKTRNQQAQIGVEKLRSHVDSLIVINNNKLREVYGNLGFKAGFSKADEVLATAARGIAEVITHHYTQNIDLRDAKTVLSDSGTAIMGSASASGDTRAAMAISKALDSPLLNDNKIKGANNVLLLIVSGKSEITLDEIGEINDHIQQEAGHSANIIMGVGEDDQLEDSISVTVIATGFDIEQQNQIANTEVKKIIHNLETDQTSKPQEVVQSVVQETPPKVIHVLDDSEDIDEITHQIRSNNRSNNVESVVKQEVVNTTAVDDSSNCETFAFEISKKGKKDHSNSQTIRHTLEENTVFEFDLTDNSSSQEDQDIQYFNLEELEQENHSQVQAQGKTTATTASFQAKVKTEPVSKTEIKHKEQVNQESYLSDYITSGTNMELNPMNTSISEILKARSSQRKSHMKEYNYKFTNLNSSVDNLEKIPAYKRAGIEVDNLDNKSSNQKISRSTISKDDESGNISIQNNNSFLHDNVD